MQISFTGNSFHRALLSEKDPIAVPTEYYRYNTFIGHFVLLYIDSFLSNMMTIHTNTYKHIQPIILLVKTRRAVRKISCE